MGTQPSSRPTRSVQGVAAVAIWRTAASATEVDAGGACAPRQNGATWAMPENKTSTSKSAELQVLGLVAGGVGQVDSWGLVGRQLGQRKDRRRVGGRGVGACR